MQIVLPPRVTFKQHDIYDFDAALGFFDWSLAAISYRDRHLLPAVDAGEPLLIDFDGVISAPHSFLSALLATAIQRMGMQAYKRIKVVNASPEIRETIDSILDENTAGGFANGE